MLFEVSFRVKYINFWWGSATWFDVWYIDNTWILVKSDTINFIKNTDVDYFITYTRNRLDISRSMNFSLWVDWINIRDFSNDFVNNSFWWFSTEDVISLRYIFSITAWNHTIEFKHRARNASWYPFWTDQIDWTIS